MFATSQSAEYARAVRPCHAAALRVGLTALATIALFGFATSATAARFDFDSTPGRLPKDVVPTHYTLRFDLDPARDTFTGQAEIDLTVRRPTSSIVLQATELDATQAALSDQSGTSRDVVIATDKDASLWRISLEVGRTVAARSLAARASTIAARSKRGVRGCFASSTAPPGRDSPRRMLATQLEPTHARAVFPSFDEPAFRATFDIVITAPSEFESVSNMPVAAQTVLADGRRETAFARSPSMPTYLVALAVGEFDALDRQLRRHRTAHSDRARTRSGSALRDGGHQADCWPTTAITSASRTCCPSSTSWRFRACAAARWRTGARSPTTKTCCSMTPSDLRPGSSN